ncbi:prolipoprotein diacylglyceryl transferase [Aeromicrobium sp. REDSEA-S32_B7]|uniref:prolipoprotein diacylglyceryl transferase n=1 Tax=Aeromicrobium sp. REDSEA-S32_B7 TaxID=1811526 RepID=UPI002955909A|nr:prolipoprotein diacylglyceryl transferase [Aeromicrobium sp. REDSEA-S32_B7]
MGDNSAIAFSVFGLPIRWYALAYLAGIFVGYWYLTKLIDQPGSPMARRHADDMIFYAMLGIILGGRIGYVLFYNLESYIRDPAAVFRLWDGGMSLHGGVLGVLVAIWYVTRKEKLSFLRFCDYVACVVPFGLFFGRLANFVNGELWGRATTVPWAIIFPESGTMDPRHPSQLYEAGLEGIVMMAVLAWFFVVEYFREPDVQRQWVVDMTGLSMGQWLTVPMLLAGIWLVATAKGRRKRVEPVAGSDSVA